MEWVDRMNAVIEYVETHLTDEISTDEVSKIIACPYGVFQRSFIQITGIPLTEYVRRRQLMKSRIPKLGYWISL
jgi:AraC family transcriptional regulator